MIQIKQAVIVEGKYDKIKVSNILDTLIIETDGFGIFKDKNKQKLIRRLAETRGILILTDSDSAGFTIRSFKRNRSERAAHKRVYSRHIRKGKTQE